MNVVWFYVLPSCNTSDEPTIENTTIVLSLLVNRAFSSTYVCCGCFLEQRLRGFSVSQQWPHNLWFFTVHIRMMSSVSFDNLLSLTFSVAVFDSFKHRPKFHLSLVDVFGSQLSHLASLSWWTQLLRFFMQEWSFVMKARLRYITHPHGTSWLPLF